MDEIPAYNDRIVAFIDILGFESLILSIPHNSDLHKRICLALKDIKAIRDSSFMEGTAQSDLEVNQFSDSIAISAKPSNKGFFSVVWACGWLQANLLYFGILTRGGIAVGPTVHQSDIIYGEGMISAYKIESKAAVYPRIVVDESVLEHPDIEYGKDFLSKDYDGLWFIDPFEFEASCPGDTELLADGADPRKIYLCELGKHIETGLMDASRVDHKSKWRWLENRYEKAVRSYERGEKTTFMRFIDEIGNFSQANTSLIKY